MCVSFTVGIGVAQFSEQLAFQFFHLLGFVIFQMIVAEQVQAAMDDQMRPVRLGGLALLGGFALQTLGGAAAILAGQRMPKVKAVATIGAPFDPAHSIFHFADAIGDIDAHGTQTLSIAGRDIPISREFLETLADINPETYIHKLRTPLLLLHSPTDQTVGIDSAQKIFLVARYPKSLISLDKADHLLIKPGAPQRAADLIRTWAEPYLPDAA